MQRPLVRGGTKATDDKKRVRLFDTSAQYHVDCLKGDHSDIIARVDAGEFRSGAEAECAAAAKYRGRLSATANAPQLHQSLGTAPTSWPRSNPRFGHWFRGNTSIGRQERQCHVYGHYEPTGEFHSRRARWLQHELDRDDHRSALQKCDNYGPAGITASDRVDCHLCVGPSDQ